MGGFRFRDRAWDPDSKFGAFGAEDGIEVPGHPFRVVADGADNDALVLFQKEPFPVRDDLQPEHVAEQIDDGLFYVRAEHGLFKKLPVTLLDFGSHQSLEFGLEGHLLFFGQGGVQGFHVRPRLVELSAPDQGPGSDQAEGLSDPIDDRLAQPVVEIVDGQLSGFGLFAALLGGDLVLHQKSLRGLDVLGDHVAQFVIRSGGQDGREEKQGQQGGDEPQQDPALYGCILEGPGEPALDPGLDQPFFRLGRGSFRMGGQALDFSGQALLLLGTSAGFGL